MESFIKRDKSPSTRLRSASGFTESRSAVSFGGLYKSDNDYVVFQYEKINISISFVLLGVF